MTSETATPHRVLVLLASHNGRAWLPEQLASILNQDGVTVRVLISDDDSTDGTREWCEEQADADPRIALLPPERFGSAAKNFFHLISAVGRENSDWVAFSDQDDIWQPGKLAAQAEILHSSGGDGVSSDVTAFDEQSGRRMHIRKSQPQRRFDYLCEAPGPGSTFLMHPDLVRAVQDVLAGPGPGSQAALHDWLVYAVSRARGGRWTIMDRATVDYRQHSANVIGANSGLAAARTRLQLMREHWHRRQATLMAKVALEVAPTAERPTLSGLLALLENTGFRSRLRLMARVSELRRRRRDRWVIRLLLLVGSW